MSVTEVESIELLESRIRNLELFMMAVAKEVGCLPDYADSLPDGGNSHIMRKLKELTQ
jgi:hypothetical protein